MALELQVLDQALQRHELGLHRESVRARSDRPAADLVVSDDGVFPRERLDEPAVLRVSHIMPRCDTQPSPYTSGGPLPVMEYATRPAGVEANRTTCFICVSLPPPAPAVTAAVRFGAATRRMTATSVSASCRARWPR